MKIYLFLTFFLLSCLVPKSSLAHGDLHARILKVTQEIESTPDSAFLYYKRGKLLFHHEDFKQAIEDLSTSRSKGYNDTMQDLILAKSHLSIGNLNDAKKECNSIKSRNPNNIHANKVLAKILIQEQKYTEAAILYEDVIDHAFKVFPENYLTAADTWLKTNTPEGITNAIRLLHEGIQSQGHLISFYEELKSLFILQQDNKNAIIAQEKIIELSTRTETGYYQLARIYQLSGNLNEAKEYFKKAQKQLKSLPARVRNNKAMQELNNNIEKSLELLNN